MTDPSSDPVEADALRVFAAGVLEGAGLRRDDAALVGDTLVQADLWGHPSHGVMRLPWYVARLRSGAVSAQAAPEIVSDLGAVAVLDGRDAMGQVSAAAAARAAVARAKAHGVGVVAVRNSNHFGTAMYFTLMAARAGCIGFLSSNASPAMPPWGGRRKGVGTNPWSWAAPVEGGDPMVLDIANTGVARGKIFLARARGTPIPLGWALDADGRDTTDPQAALDGVTLPMAGHKGYAIAVLMDVLSGVLTGGGFGRRVQGPYQAETRGDAGHLMLALDIAAFQPEAQFAERMAELVAELRATPLAAGFDAIAYPGEPEARSDRRLRASGLTLPEETLRDLRKLAGEMDLPGISGPAPASPSAPGGSGEA